MSAHRPTDSPARSSVSPVAVGDYRSQLTAGETSSIRGVALRAFADRGDAIRPFDCGPAAAEQTIPDADQAGKDPAALTAALEDAGVAASCEDYRERLDCVTAKTRETRPAIG